MNRTVCVLVALVGFGCGTAPSTTNSRTEGEGTVVAPQGGASPEPGKPDPTEEAQGTPSCSAAQAQLLKPVGSISEGEVRVLSEKDGERTLYVDATAGGALEAGSHPRLYLNLDTAQKVLVTDTSASTSTAWDLALKRPVLFTNSGHGGPGLGGALFLAGVTFEDVTLAAASAKTFPGEVFFDAECNPQLDAIGAVRTSFDGWYDYDTATNGVSPRKGTWLVRGATGHLFKVEIRSYYATPNGGTGTAGGRYVLRVKAL